MRPPRLTRALLRRLLPGDAAEFVVGDLDEEFARYCTAADGARAGRLRAGAWYRWQALRTLLPFWGAARRDRSIERPTTPGTAPHIPGPHALILRSPGDLPMSSLWQDLRFTVRNLRRAPGFSFTVLLTLGLGIGAATAMFSAVNEVMLRPLTFREPDRLVMLYDDNALRDWQRVEASPANVLDWKARVTTFEDVAMVYPWTTDVALELDGEAVAVAVGQVSGNLFAVLGTPPFHGRTFTDDETWDHAAPVVLLGYDIWARRFGADEGIVGSTIDLDGTSFEVIGVMPPGFRFAINDAEMWTTFRWPDSLREQVWFRQAHVVKAIARLQPGATVQQARDELAAVGAQLRLDYPQLNEGMEPGLVGLQGFLVGDRRRPLMLLLGAVGLLQLIACANVANLLLVRANGRRQELAVRAALGAGRARLARLLVSEAALLAAGGALLGVVVAAGLMRWLEAIRPPELPELVLRADPRVLTFTAVVAVGSALLFSLAPVVRAAGLRLTGRLAEGSRTGSATRSTVRTAGGIVSLEMALAVLLVIGAGLMVRSMARLTDIEVDYDPARILTFELTPPSGLYPQASDRAAFAYRLIEQLDALPGVRAAGATRNLPLTGYGWSSDFDIEGWGPEKFGTDIRHRNVTSEYFAAMSVPLIEGEIFDDALAPGQHVPVVVNQAFVDRYFPGESPVGRRVSFDRHPDESSYWYPIVGVVGNERMVYREEPEPEIISHLLGDTPNTLRFVLSTEVPPETLVAAVRDTVARVDARIPFVLPRTMEQVAADELVRDRFLMTLLGVFALSALVLAAVGVYGVAAQGARARTREIGIRMALGATGEQIVGQLVRGGGVFVLIGLLLGFAGAVAASRLIAGFLFDIEPLDPATWAGVGLVLAAVGLVASYLPARAAARTDPAEVLHVE